MKSTQTNQSLSLQRKRLCLSTGSRWKEFLDTIIQNYKRKRTVSKATLDNLSNLSFEEAKNYIGKETEDGKVIGVTTKPNGFHSTGVYLVVSHSDTKSSYKKVG